MEVIDTGKFNFAFVLHASLLTGEKKSNITLSGCAISENKAERSDDLTTNNFSVSSFTLHGATKEVFLSKAEESFSIPIHMNSTWKA